jgi:hypothetical protein
MREHVFCAVALFASQTPYRQSATQGWHAIQTSFLLSHFLTQSVTETDNKGEFSMAFPQARPMEHAGTDLDS